MYKRSYVQKMIELFAEDDQNRTAVKIYNGKQITDISYCDLARRILCAANFFKDHCLTGRHIALMGANSLEWIVSFFAIAANGNVVVPLNPALPGEIIRSQCKLAGVSVICGDIKETAAYTQDYLCVSYGAFCEKTPMRMDDIVCPDRTALSLLLFTSGTTGASKAVEITYANMESSLKSKDGVFSMPDISRIMTALPMFHIAGIRGALAMLYRYKTLCIGRGVMYLFRDMPILSPDYILMVPMMVESFIKIVKRTSRTDLRKNYIGTRLKRICIGGATVDPGSCRYLMEAGFTIDSGYALSETTGVGTWGEWDAAHFNTIGKVSEELECRIVEGEIQFRGPAVMKGYYKDPEATKAAIENGWLHTGDLGYCDEDGYFYLTGRKKNLIVMPNGEKLNPEEVEKQLARNDAVKECRIRYLDKENVLCVEVCSDNREAVRELIALYNEKMPLSFQIHKIVFREEPLERTASGKIIRKE